MLKTVYYNNFALKILETEFSRSKASIFMSQRKYALDILRDTGFTGARPDKSPMEQYLKLTPDEGELLKDPVKYSDSWDD